MKNGQTTLMLLVLCLASLAPLMTPQDTLSSPNVEQDTSGRAAVDFTIIDVAVGNSTEPAEIWEQPDGTSLDYMLRNVRYEVKITFKNAGTVRLPVIQSVHLRQFIRLDSSWKVGPSI